MGRGSRAFGSCVRNMHHIEIMVDHDPVFVCLRVVLQHVFIVY